MKRFVPERVKHPEDEFFCEFPFLGVIDGYSEPYWPGKPQKDFSPISDGVTGGQMATQAIKKTFGDFSPTDNPPLTVLAQRANSEIHHYNKEMGLNPENAGEVPGASFVIARISQHHEIELAQSGDCLAVWRCQNGKIDYTFNPVYEYEMERLDIINQLSEKYQSDQAKLWKEFGPWLTENRRRVVNKYYPILNGMEIAPDLLKKYLINEIPQDLILFTDGLIGCQKTKRMDAVAEEILELYFQGGLEAVFKKAGETEQKDKPKHAAGGQVEKTAVAIEF